MMSPSSASAISSSGVCFCCAAHAFLIAQRRTGAARPHLRNCAVIDGNVAFVEKVKRTRNGPYFPDPHPPHAAELLWRTRRRGAPQARGCDDQHLYRSARRQGSVRSLEGLRHHRVGPANARARRILRYGPGRGGVPALRGRYPQHRRAGREQAGHPRHPCDARLHRVGVGTNHRHDGRYLAQRLGIRDGLSHRQNADCARRPSTEGLEPRHHGLWRYRTISGAARRGVRHERDDQRSVQKDRGSEIETGRSADLAERERFRRLPGGRQ